jgi:1-acyl-sn-glycerol-3-phosphate acyltransferase
LRYGERVSWIRLAGLVLVLLGTSLVLLAGRVLLVFAPGVRPRFRRRVFQAASRAVLSLMRVTVRVSGPIPSPPFLLVANHLGYLDVPVLAHLLPCVFVSKAEIRRWPVMGSICRDLGTVFIEREVLRDIPRALAAMEEAFTQGQGIIFFPEGTSSQGAGVLPFRTPLLALAARLGHPVHYAALSYRTGEGDPPAGQAVCWWGGTPFVPHLLKLLKLNRIEATVDFGPEPIAEADRKRLAERLRAGILERFKPVE